MGTALIHGDNIPLTVHGIVDNGSNTSLFRHHEILRITQELSQRVAGSIIDNDFSAIERIDDFSDIVLLKTYGGIEVDDLKEWFRDVYANHTGLLHSDGMHWRDPESYKKQPVLDARAAPASAAHEQMDENPFSIENGSIAYQGQKESLQNLFKIYKVAEASENFNLNPEEERACLSRMLDRLIPDLSRMKQNTFNALYAKFETVFKKEYQEHMNTVKRSFDKKVEKVPPKPPEKFGDGGEKKEGFEESKADYSHVDAMPAVEPRLEFIKEKLVRGLFNEDGIDPPAGDQPIMPHSGIGSFERACTDFTLGPAAYLETIIGSNPYKYGKMTAETTSLILSMGESVTKENLKFYMADAEPGYGRIGALGLYLQYIQWAKENSARKNPGYLGFDAGFAYNISHEENREYITHPKEIARFQKNAEEAFRNGYASYAALVKNQHPERASEHFWCIFATKNKDTNTIKDVYVFNPSGSDNENETLDAATYETILLPLKMAMPHINIDSGDAQRIEQGGFKAFYRGSLNSFLTGIQSEAMACGISSSSLARYFVTLPADQIDTRVKVITRLKEFQRTLGYKDSHLITEGLSRGLYNLKKVKAQPSDVEEMRRAQTHGETVLGESVKNTFDEIYQMLDGKTLADLPSVLQEYIAGVRLTPQGG